MSVALGAFVDDEAPAQPVARLDQLLAKAIADECATLQKAQP
jgi:hypothetical protein